MLSGYVPNPHVEKMFRTSYNGLRAASIPANVQERLVNAVDNQERVHVPDRRVTITHIPERINVPVRQANIDVPVSQVPQRAHPSPLRSNVRAQAKTMLHMLINMCIMCMYLSINYVPFYIGWASVRTI